MIPSLPLKKKEIHRDFGKEFSICHGGKRLSVILIMVGRVKNLKFRREKIGQYGIDFVFVKKSKSFFMVMFEK